MSYEIAILADTPVVYWRLDEPSGTTVNDTSGNAHPGTYNGGPTLGVASPIATDPASTAVTFDGTSDDQYAKGTDDIGNADYTRFVLEGWFYIPTAHAADSQGWIAAVSNADGSKALWIARSAEDVPGLATVRCNWTGSGLPGAGIGLNAIPDTWYYFSCGFDGTTAWFFYSSDPGGGGGSNSYDLTALGSFDLTGETAHLFVGGNDLSAGDGLFGRVDEVAFYDYSPTFDADEPTFGPSGRHVTAAAVIPAGGFAATGSGLIDVQVGFGSGPTDMSPTLSSIAADVLDISITRGRRSMLSPFGSMSATITLDNTSGRYDPKNATGPHYGEFNMRSLVKISALDSGSVRHNLAVGYVIPNGWSNKYPYAHGATATLTIGDLFLFCAPKLATLIGIAEAGDLPGWRMNSILAELGIDETLQNIDDGDTVLQGPAVDDKGGAGIDLLQLIADTDGGFIYVDKNGAFTFDARLAPLMKTRMIVPQAAFSDAGGTDVPMTVVDWDYDDALCNDAEITRLGDDAPQIVTDPTSITNNGLAQIARSGQLMQNQPDAYARAEFLVAAFKEPVFSPSIIEIDAIGDGDLALDEACHRELVDRASVEFTTPAGATDTAECFLEQITHRITVAPSLVWRTQFALASAERFGFADATEFIVLGLGPALDTGRLAY